MLCVRTAFIERLTNSGFSEDQAEALSEAIKTVQKAHLEELATKRDLAELETRLIKWVVGIAGMQAAIIIAILKLTA